MVARWQAEGELARGQRGRAFEHASSDKVPRGASAVIDEAAEASNEGVLTVFEEGIGVARHG